MTLVLQYVINFIYQETVDQPTFIKSNGIKLHIMMFTLLDFLRKVMSTATMQSAISGGESVKILLMPH